ncbi:MAG: hypothetical protein ACRDO8_11160, partial [Nocardioidaceae bacterium]
MTTQSIPFFSDRHMLDADLHLPDDDGAHAPYPVVVACSGFEGLKVIHPERGRLVPQEWAEDVRSAVGRLGVAPQVDADRVALLGWGLGGGVVVAAAADDPKVRAVVVANGIGDGARSIRTMHDDESWQQLVERIDRDRGHRALHGRSEITTPWDIVRLGTGTPVGSYVGEELYQAHGFGSRVTLESADHLLRFRPEDMVGQIAPRPLLIVHGSQNRLHRPEEAEELYRR